MKGHLLAACPPHDVSCTGPSLSLTDMQARSPGLLATAWARSGPLGERLHLSLPLGLSQVGPACAGVPACWASAPRQLHLWKRLCTTRAGPQRCIRKPSTGMQERTSSRHVCTCTRGHMCAFLFAHLAAQTAGVACMHAQTCTLLLQHCPR